ncbi:CYTH domain-containing protein [Mesoterricola silvestris]|uniref:Uncharacterized protein n=1 Tax=Mesoterricola silvestris TaxID=2927979 RepID=A0AA48GQD7_9BACT|nr:hypothetical protein [Mesoterricola silvestris]BDU73795.1 hypothetical protein METEAL_29690 [Mesoterricola silvestris]
MIRNIVAVLLVAGSVAPGAWGAAPAQAKALHLRTIEKYPAPKLEKVNGREIKFLLDPAKLKGSPEEAFALVWDRVKASAARNGFTITEKAEKPLKIEKAYKEYFDTPGQDLWKKGYLVRITQKFKKGVAEFQVGLTIKAVNPDANVAMATPLKVVGVEKVKVEAEENAGPAAGGGLDGYVEKGASFNVTLDSLGKLTLGDFAKYMPELATLGIPADTKLVGNRAYSVRVKPGAVELAGTDDCGFSMEGWSTTPGGAPYLYDFSYGYGDIDFYDSAALHEASEKFYYKVVLGDLGDLAMPQAEKWGGSKVRKLMNRPISR